jgi:hypothetical protein
MYIELTITAIADRDDSCNMFTYTEAYNFRISDPPTPDKIRALLQEHKDKFMEMWPHKGVAKPHLVPLDVSVRTLEGRMP